MSVKLRPYQDEALEVMKLTKAGTPTLIVLPTGSGKGTLFAALANSSIGRVLVVVPSGELLNQGIEKIKQFNPDADVGRIQAQTNQLDTKIMCGTRQSLTHTKSTRIETMLKHGEVEYIILDEAHNAIEQLERITKKLKQVKIIGMTATPYNSKMNKIFKEINYQKSILDMINDGYLCEPRAIKIESKTDLNKIKTVAGDFKQDELEKTVNNIERNRLVVKAYREFASERKATIVFASGIAHSQHLYEEFISEDIPCGCIDSEMNKLERDGIIKKFEEGKIKVLVNVNILSTGYDLPKIDCVLLARPTKSKIFYTQAIGRGLRIFPDKEDTLIIDISDNCRSHDLMSLSSIFDMPIKHGETVKRAITRIKKEKEDEEKRKAEEEERRLEREKIKLEEIKIKAEQIKLFNKDMKNRIEERKLDFFRVDNLSYALSYAVNVHYVIEDYQSKYIIYNVVTSKDEKRAEYITEFDSLSDGIAYIEKRVNKNAFTLKNADWKSDPATENQRKYCGFARTKGEAHKFFSSSSIVSALKKWKKENVS